MIRGLFDPDKTLGYYLPWFRFSDKGDMVLRDMLAHQSGLTVIHTILEHIPWRMTVPSRAVYSAMSRTGSLRLPVTDSLYMNRHYLKEMFREIRDSPRQVRRSIVYSDLTFILAAEIVESLTDTTIDRFAPTNMYRPIGAFNITYNPLEKYP
ncbi:MAG: beta-lactamase family protein [Marinilabiliales bacterium]|nr:beta-lactamase family protein [Marinilabiliales bacterium]